MFKDFLKSRILQTRLSPSGTISSKHRLPHVTWEALLENHNHNHHVRRMGKNILNICGRVGGWESGWVFTDGCSDLSLLIKSLSGNWCQDISALPDIPCKVITSKSFGNKLYYTIHDSNVLPFVVTIINPQLLWLFLVALFTNN